MQGQTRGALLAARATYTLGGGERTHELFTCLRDAERTCFIIPRYFPGPACVLPAMYADPDTWFEFTQRWQDAVPLKDCGHYDPKHYGGPRRAPPSGNELDRALESNDLSALAEIAQSRSTSLSRRAIKRLASTKEGRQRLGRRVTAARTPMNGGGYHASLRKSRHGGCRSDSQASCRGDNGLHGTEIRSLVTSRNDAEVQVSGAVLQETAGSLRRPRRTSNGNRNAGDNTSG